MPDLKKHFIETAWGFKKKILRSLTLARKYRYLCTNIHQYGILETTIILSWFTAVIKLMIVLPWSLNGRCSWKRSIYIQKKNSKILFACMYSWFFSILPSYYCTCGTLVKNMIYRRQCTQKSPRHNIGKKIINCFLKNYLKFFFRLDLIMDYYNIQVYNGTSLSFYYPGNFIWWEINSQSQLIWTRNHFLTVILSNWNPSCNNLLFISSDKIVMNSSDIDTNKCRCFWNCSALVSLYQDLDGYNMIKFSLMITVFHSLLDGLSPKTISSKSLAAWGNNCSKSS